MKVLVVGGSGLFGGYILREGKKRGYEMVGTFRHHPVEGLLHCDLGDTLKTEILLNRESPEVVIHAAGWTHVDGCEQDPDRALKENAVQPAQLGRMAREIGAAFIYVSSAYVFDGKEGDYQENRIPHPINQYGVSKLEGERRVMKSTDDAAMIARVIWLYGWERRKKNYAYQVLDALQHGKELMVPEDQWGNPTFAGDAARMLLHAILERRSGIVHLVNTTCCSRLKWTRRLIEGFTVNGATKQHGFKMNDTKSGTDKTRAARPLKACLKSSYPFADSKGTEVGKVCQEIIADIVREN